MTKTEKKLQEEKILEAGLEKCRSFAAKVRLIVAACGPVHLDDIYAYLMIDDGDRKHKMAVNTALRDGQRTDKVVMLAERIYGPGPKLKHPPQNKKQVMWRVIRARKVVTRDDLVEMAGVSYEYAKEYLLGLARLEIVRSHDNGKYRLLKDTVEPPEMTYNAEKLHRLRERQRQEKELKEAKDLMGSAMSHLDHALDLLAGEASHG